tara:strand:- start:8291 stop:8539 length:249 start_codon:yes stop_codon:yes gene_type:complete
MVKEYMVKTQSGSKYIVEKRNKKEWVLFRNGVKPILFFGDKNPSTIKDDNLKDIIGRPIWFMDPEKDAAGRTTKIVSIRKIS